MSPAEACKNYVLKGWAFGNSAVEETPVLSGLVVTPFLKPSLQFALHYFIGILLCLDPRDVYIFGAFWETSLGVPRRELAREMRTEQQFWSQESRLDWGGHFFGPREQPRGFAVRWGQKFLDLLIPRKSQIFAVEAIVPLIAMLWSPVPASLHLQMPSVSSTTKLQGRWAPHVPKMLVTCLLPCFA